MQTLILMRHAKAQSSAPSGEDHDRELSERGVEDAAIMGRWLAECGLVPDLGLVSTAERTRGTWAAAAQAFGDPAVRYDARLYNAGAAYIRGAVEAAEHDGRVIMVVGHNPGIHQAVIDLMVEAAEAPSLIDRARSRFPTATAAVFEFDEHLRPRFAGLNFVADHGGGAGE